MHAYIFPQICCQTRGSYLALRIAFIPICRRLTLDLTPYTLYLTDTLCLRHYALDLVTYALYLIPYTSYQVYTEDLVPDTYKMLPDVSQMPPSVSVLLFLWFLQGFFPSRWPCTICRRPPPSGARLRFYGAC